MRVLDTGVLVDIVSEMAIEACVRLPADVKAALGAAARREESPYGREALGLCVANADCAERERIALCQDTGTCVVFMEIGQEVCWSGAPLADMVNEGVRRGYTDGYLRKSMVPDPILRGNTGDNTPAVLHTEIVPGDTVKITLLPKGGGSENCGAFATLLPSAGEAGITQFVLDTVKKAGGKCCPPGVVGVGIGGTMDYCCLLAKKALLRPVGERNADPRYAALEESVLKEVNALGVGPLGMGGSVTALDVHIEQYPCHITALPAAVNMQCHSDRRSVRML
jgi:fumarate hydratase subunit alpha